MLRLEPIEFILRAIPEGFLFILAVYIFSNTKIDKRKYIISSVIYGVILYLVRLLPISYGVHTILSLMFLILFTNIYNKIDAIKVMKSVLIIFIIQFLTEGLNILILNLIPNIDLDIMFKSALIKNLLGLPSLIVAYLIIYLFYLKNKKRDR